MVLSPTESSSHSMPLSLCLSFWFFFFPCLVWLELERNSREMPFPLGLVKLNLSSEKISCAVLALCVSMYSLICKFNIIALLETGKGTAEDHCKLWTVLKLPFRA